MKFFILNVFFVLISSAFAGKVVIDQKGKKFLDASGKEIKKIDVKLGDTLVFKNSETSVTHNVFSFSKGNGFELKTQGPGKESEVPLNKGKHAKGVMDVECAIHPEMKLKVNIQ